MNGEHKKPLSSSVDNTTDNLINSLKTLTPELQDTNGKYVELRKKERSENANTESEKANDCLTQEAKRACIAKIDVERVNSNHTECKNANNLKKNRDAAGSTESDIERKHPQEVTASFTRNNGRQTPTNDDWDREKAIANVAATLVREAIKKAKVQIANDDEDDDTEELLDESLSDDYDLFSLSHRSIFRFLQGIEELTESFIIHNESESEAKKVLGSLWLMLLKDIESGLYCSGVDVPMARFFDTMDALHVFFQNNDTTEWINAKQLWPLKKAYFHHMPFYFSHAQQFNRDPFRVEKNTYDV